MPLGTLQKGSFDVAGASVELIPVQPSSPTSPNLTRESNRVSRKAVPEWVLRVRTPNSAHPIDLGVESKDECVQWAITIR